MTPLSRPQTRQTANVARAAGSGCIPQSTIPLAKIMPPRLTRDPREISSSPVQMIKNWPAARIATMDTCRRTFIALPPVRKLGPEIPNTTISTMIGTMIT